MLDPPFPSWPVKSDAVDRYAMLAMPFWLRAKSTKRPAEDPVDATLAEGLLPPQSSLSDDKRTNINFFQVGGKGVELE
jgi:hypothetical protein